MKRILGIVILVFLIGTAGFSAETNKGKMIKELLSVTKLDDTASKLADELLSGLLKNNSNITEKQQMAFAEEMQNFLNYILTKQASLYDENYSEKEIKEMLSSVKSEAGKLKLALYSLLPVSAKRKTHLDILKDILSKAQKNVSIGTDTTLVTNIRHYQALSDTRDALLRVNEGLDQSVPTDLLTQDIREALFHIGEIVGEINTEELLGNIFSKFCIGK